MTHGSHTRLGSIRRMVGERSDLRNKDDLTNETHDLRHPQWANDAALEWRRCLVGVAVLMACLASPLVGQAQIRILERREFNGQIESSGEGRLIVRESSGETLTLKIQDRDEEAIVLSGGGGRLRFPCEIRVTGEFPCDDLSAGRIVNFQANVSRRGRARGDVSVLNLVPEQDAVLSVEMIAEQDQPNGYPLLEVMAIFKGKRNQRAEFEIADSELIRTNRLFVTFSDDAKVVVDTDDLGTVGTGDRVVAGTIARLSTGDWAVESITIELAATSLGNEGDSEASRYLNLSDQPSEPRTVRSQNFLIYTDISDRQAQILLDKLEVMTELIGQYFGRTTPAIVECYVIENLEQWDVRELNPDGLRKIARGEGVTFSQSLGRQTKSIVYSCADHGVVQHEAVHALCAQTFGSTGPTWYAEGMAEMGHYWRPGERTVNINPAVIEYLRNAEPKSMLGIVAAGQITGDSWQAYAWRWALCHLLANNPNYAERFKALGLAMMRSRGDSFESVFGAVANEVSFEYDQFVQNFGNGYRADLCAWDWQTPFNPIRLRRRVSLDVEAMSGWQATGVRVQAGWRLVFEADGEWAINGLGETLSADGDARGRGRLVGAYLNGFTLSEPFEIGTSAESIAPQEGDLYVRCFDQWTELSDNSGTIELTIRRESGDE